MSIATVFILYDEDLCAELSGSASTCRNKERLAIVWSLSKGIIHQRDRGIIFPFARIIGFGQGQNAQNDASFVAEVVDRSIDLDSDKLLVLMARTDAADAVHKGDLLENHSVHKMVVWVGDE